MKKTYMLLAGVMFFTFSAFSQTCTDNNGLGLGTAPAPCSENPPVSADFFSFEVWRGDQYTWTNLKQGGNYVFDICQGVGGAAWPASFTVVDPQGGIVAIGTDAGSSCEISFTAPLNGDYDIFIIESGVCPPAIIPPDSLGDDNGIPRLTYEGGASCDPPITTCEAGSNDGITESVLCPGETTTFSVSGVVIPDTPTLGDALVSFQGVDSTSSYGELVVPSSLSQVGAGDSDYTFDNTLNGLLGSPQFPVLQGPFNVRLIVISDQSVTAFDPTNRCDSTASELINFLPGGDLSCNPVTTCEAGTLELDSLDTALCPEESTTFSVTGFTVPNSPGNGEYNILFTPVDGSGSGGPFGSEPDPSFFLTVNVPPGTENADFSLTLSATLAEAVGDTLPALEGEWNVTGLVFASETDTLPCDQLDPVTIDFQTSDDFACGGPAPCENPYPQVDESSITFTERPSGAIEVFWDPIPGQIGCQVNVVIGDLQNPLLNGSVTTLGPAAGTLFIPVQFIQPFTAYNVRVRCGCSVSPFVVGEYTDFVTTISGLSGIGLQPEIGNSGLHQKRQRAYMTSSLGSSANFEKSMTQSGVQGTIRKARSTKAVKTSEFEVFPNPSDGMINIDYSASGNGMINLRVYDMLGKAVDDFSFPVNEGNNIVNMDISSQEAGIYLLEIREGNKISTSKVVIK